MRDLAETVKTNPEVEAQTPKSLQPSLQSQICTAEDSTLVHQSHIESLVNSKRSVSNAWSEVSKSTNFESGFETWGTKQLGVSSLPQRRIISGESRRPTSSMAGEGSWQSDASSTKSKR